MADTQLQSLAKNPVRRASKTWRAISGLVLVVAIAGVWAYQYRERYKYFAVHDPGKVLRSSWLQPDAVEEIVRKYHVRTVVNLCDPYEKAERITAERRAVEAAGGQLVELVFPPNNTWDAEYEVLREFEKIVDDPASYPIYVHCWHGVERTAKALAIYDIRQRGMTAHDSLEGMRLGGRQHPGPIVTFVYTYEDLNRKRLAGQGTDSLK